MAVSTILYRTCVIALLAVAAAGVDSIRRPISTKPLPPAPALANGKQSALTIPAAPGDDGLHISLARARELFLAKAPFVDARSRAEYEAKHVEGAFFLPIEAFSAGTPPEAVKIMDPASPVVVYCTGGDCHASDDVVINLQGFGFIRCYVMKEGFPAWEAAGYETAGGPDAIGGGH